MYREAKNSMMYIEKALESRYKCSLVDNQNDKDERRIHKNNAGFTDERRNFNILCKKAIKTAL